MCAKYLEYHSTAPNPLDHFSYIQLFQIFLLTNYAIVIFISCSKKLKSAQRAISLHFHIVNQSKQSSA